MKRLESKMVVITGGNSGIEKSSALEAAEEGATIVLAHLSKVHLSETLKEAFIGPE